MSKEGDLVRCVDASSKPEWAEWYMDGGYSEDMLTYGKSYVVRAVAERDGQTGYDIGVPTPWGDPFWNADRFEPVASSLLEPVLTAATPHQHGAGNGEKHGG